MPKMTLMQMHKKHNGLTKVQVMKHYHMSQSSFYRCIKPIQHLLNPGKKYKSGKLRISQLKLIIKHLGEA